MLASWLRWILVLPASVGAAIGVRTINNIFINMFTGLGIGWAETLIELFQGFVGPFTFILVGARVAPSNRFFVSLVLSAIIITFMGLTILNFALHDEQMVTTAWLYMFLTYTISLVAIVWVCKIIYKEGKREETNKDDLNLS